MLTRRYLGLGFDPTTAYQKALAVIDLTIQRQTLLLSFADIFRIVALIIFCSIPLALLLRKSGSGGGPAPDVH